LFYFDDRDLSYEAEDREIKRGAACIADQGVSVDLRNQARVHLWYGERFGPGYPRLVSSCDGIDRFLIEATCVAVRKAGADIEVHAPYGLEAMTRGILRPNPNNLRPDLFYDKAASYKARWPWLSIEQ